MVSCTELGVSLRPKIEQTSTFTLDCELEKGILRMIRNEENDQEKQNIFMITSHLSISKILLRPYYALIKLNTRP